MSTRFEYAPCAVTSSRSICSWGGVASAPGGFAWSDIAEVYTKVVLGRVLAIDLGARRIGVAVTDALGIAALPHATLARHGGKRDLDAIAALVRAQKRALVVFLVTALAGLVALAVVARGAWRYGDTASGPARGRVEVEIPK